MRSRRAGLILAFLALSPSTRAEEARILIDAARVEGRIDPRLYGQFLEFMFEGVKGGLSAEMVRNRGFEEAPNAIGLSRHWERHPDDRNDDYGLSFLWDDTVAYPVSLEARLTRIPPLGAGTSSVTVPEPVPPVRMDGGFSVKASIRGGWSCSVPLQAALP